MKFSWILLVINTLIVHFFVMCLNIHGLDGKVETFKEMVMVDEEDRAVIADVIEGDILNEYKS